MAEMNPDNLTLNKWWNWSSCTKLALSASWTHSLIAQSVRASELNSVAADSNPTQANFQIATSKNPSEVNKYTYLYWYLQLYLYMYNKYMYIYKYRYKI